MKPIVAALVAACLSLLSQAVFAQEQVCGRAIASKDGDDLAIGDVKIRLHGVDAFERNQTCTRGDGQTWQCGEAALRKLQELVG